MREDADLSAPAQEHFSVRLAWWALIVFEIQILASNIDIAIVSLLVHPIETGLRINDVGFAAVTAMPAAIGLCIAFYPAGLLADTFRRRNMIAAGAIIWILAAIMASRATSGSMLFFARFLAGIGTVLPAPAIFSMLSDAFPHTRRAFAVGAYAAGASVGVGIGLTICGALVAATQRNGALRVGGFSFTPWQQCFVLVAAIGILVLGLIWTVTEPPRRERSATVKPTLTSTLRLFGAYFRGNSLLWTLLLLGGAIGNLSYTTITAWAPTFGTRHYGITGPTSIALLGTFMAGGSLVGSIIGAMLGQRGANNSDPRMVPKILLVSGGVCCAFGAIFPFMPSWLLSVGGMGIAEAAMVLMCVLIPIGIQETAPNDVRAQLYGFWGLLFWLPSIGAATLVAFLASGIFAKSGGLGPALAVVGGVTGLISAVLFAFSGQPYERAKKEMNALIVRTKSQI